MEPELRGFTVDWEVDDYEMKGMYEQAVDGGSAELFPSRLGRDGTIAWMAAYRSGGRKAYWETRSNSFRPCQTHHVARWE